MLTSIVKILDKHKFGKLLRDIFYDLCFLGYHLTFVFGSYKVLISDEIVP